MSPQSASTRLVTYEPPSPETLERFAHDVCRELGPDYTAPEVVHGLAHFLNVVAQAHTKQLNRQHDEALSA
jgi:hypothetical protein